MNIPVPPANTIEWPKVEYEYLCTICNPEKENCTYKEAHTNHMNNYATKGWELINIWPNPNSTHRITYFWRKLKVLGVPLE